MRLPAPLLRQNKRSHKNDYGHLLVVAGSPSMLGAACLVSLAAMRFGAGLVTAAIPAKLNLALQQKINHAIMTMPVPGTKDGVFSLRDARILAENWSRYNALSIGPGLGSGPATIKFVQTIVNSCPLPMVIDADALNAIAPSFRERSSKNRLTCLNARILTPHPGEFYRMSGLRPKTDRERLQAAKDFAISNNVILVLKGHRTVVASPKGEVYVNKTGNAGMAKAGMGDVLTGMTGALLAQGVPAFEAAKVSVFWHGKIADICVRGSNDFSLTAVDIINAFPAIR